MLKKTITKLPKPKAIIFDWDNTLVETWSKMMKCTNLTFEAFGKTPLTLAEIKDNVHYSAKDSFPVIFGKDADKATAMYYDYYLNVYGDETLKPFDGVEEMLQELKSLGIHLFVLSNKNGNVLRKEVTLLGYDKYFDKVVGSLDALEDKPSKLAVEYTLNGIQSGSDVWLVGDTEVDMLCAHNAGCTKIFFGDGNTSFKTTKISSHKELLDLL